MLPFPNNYGSNLKLDNRASIVVLGVQLVVSFGWIVGLLPLLVYVLVNSVAMGFFLGRWMASREHAQRARLAAIQSTEQFIGALHRELVDGQVPAEKVDEVELILSAARESLAQLDSMAPRRWLGDG